MKEATNTATPVFQKFEFKPEELNNPFPHFSDYSDFTYNQPQSVIIPQMYQPHVIPFNGNQYINYTTWGLPQQSVRASLQNLNYVQDPRKNVLCLKEIDEWNRKCSMNANKIISDPFTVTTNNLPFEARKTYKKLPFTYFRKQRRKKASKCYENDKMNNFYNLIYPYAEKIFKNFETLFLSSCFPDSFCETSDEVICKEEYYDYPRTLDKVCLECGAVVNRKPISTNELYSNFGVDYNTYYDYYEKKQSFPKEIYDTQNKKMPLPRFKYLNEKSSFNELEKNCIEKEHRSLSKNNSKSKYDFISVDKKEKVFLPKFASDRM